MTTTKKQKKTKENKTTVLIKRRQKKKSRRRQRKNQEGDKRKNQEGEKGILHFTEENPLYLLLTDVSTFYKRCNECDMWFRYQEFDEGIHNFDDKHIFTISLLRFMREYVKVNGATTFPASRRPFYSQPLPRLYPVVNYPGTRDVYPHIPPLC